MKNIYIESKKILQVNNIYDLINSIHSNEYICKNESYFDGLYYFRVLYHFNRPHILYGIKIIKNVKDKNI